MVQLAEPLPDRAIPRDDATARPHRCGACGRPRAGAFRYCRSCGLDFEPFHAAERILPAIVDLLPPAREPQDAGQPGADVPRPVRPTIRLAIAIGAGLAGAAVALLTSGWS